MQLEETIMEKKLLLHPALICFFTLTSFLTASESEWKDITRQISDQATNKNVIFTDIKNIDKKLYLIGTTKKTFADIFLLSFEDNGKKLTEDVLKNTTGTDDISLAATNKAIIIQAKKDDTLKLYEIITPYYMSYIQSPYLEEIKGIYSLGKPRSIVGTKLPSEFWTCTDKGCFITGSKASNALMLNNYTPTIIGLEPEDIADTRIYWAIKDAIIKKLAFTDTEPIQTLREYKYGKIDEEEPFKNYTFKELVPYKEDAAFALGTFTGPDGKTESAIRHITLNMWKKTFAVDTIKTLHNTKTIAVKIKQNPTIYALVNDKNDFSVKTLEIMKKQDSSVIPKIDLNKGKVKQLAKETTSRSKPKNLPTKKQQSPTLPLVAPTPSSPLDTAQEAKREPIENLAPHATTTPLTTNPTTPANPTVAPTTTADNTPLQNTTSQDDKEKSSGPMGVLKNRVYQKSEPELEYFREMKKSAHIEIKGTPNDSVYVSAKEWFAKDKTTALRAPMQQEKRNTYNPIMDNKNKTNAGYWSMFKHTLSNPKASISNSWNTIKNYFRGIWGLTKVYGG